MRRFFLLALLSTLRLGMGAFAQETGRLDVTVEQAATTGSLAGPVAGAKVIVVHWTDSGGHPALVQNQTATTNQMGMCTIDLPAGTYDVFVAANELSPAAFRREVKVGETTAVTTHLRSAPLHVRPVQ